MIAAKEKSNELVVLVHGFGSKRLLMWCLERRMQRAGFATHNWGYMSYFGDLQRHARRLRDKLETLVDQTETVHIVAHSMGAIVSRLALSYGPISQFGRFVMLAPPNRGAPVARYFSSLVRPICPALSQLSDRPDSFVNQMAGCDDLDIGIISARFDFTVPSRSTALDGQLSPFEISATHSSMLFQKETARQIQSFLSTGRFQPSD